jgi:uncharacterized protein YaaQ
MKMIIAILRDVDQDNVSSSLTAASFRVTCIASTGGFWRRGNSTLLIGLEDEKIDQAITIIKAACSAPVEPETRQATLFVIRVAEFIHF